VVNPEGRVISRDFQTVSGADYWRFDFDGDGELDEQAMDYNLQYGDYKITARLRPDAGSSVITRAGIGINGSLRVTAVLNHPVGSSRMRTSEPVGADSLVFYYRVEETSSIQPPFGLPSGSTTPLFDWSGRVESPEMVDSYEFQLDRYLDFRSPRYDISGLIEPQYTPTTPLGEDSVYYWRFRSFESGQWGPYSHAFAAYIVATCCKNLTGNVDGSPDDICDLGDLTALIDYLFISFTEPECMEEANTDGDAGGLVDLGDLTALIDYLFISFTLPAACQ